MTAHPMTEVTLCLCALLAVAQWAILARGPSDEYVPAWGCLLRAITLLPYVTLAAVSPAVSDSLLTSVIPLGAGIVMSASSFVIYLSARRDPNNAGAGFMLHVVITSFIALLASGLTAPVYLLERWS
jgi:FtsH-binding integral membrane protein